MLLFLAAVQHRDSKTLGRTLLVLAVAFGVMKKFGAHENLLLCRRCSVVGPIGTVHKPWRWGSEDAPSVKLCMPFRSCRAPWQLLWLKGS